MSNPKMAVARVKREVAEVKKDKQIQECNIKLDFVESNEFTHLQGEIPGPDDTPFAGGTFKLDIMIPDAYPFSPPKVKFITKIWHPNVSSQTGAICLDILKDQWAAAMTLRTVLLSIQALMSAAEPDDPQDAVVAQQYKKDLAQYKKTAAHWTAAYAGGKASGEEAALVKQVMDMGFGEEQARNALSTKAWNLEQAIEMLLSS
eukprot:m.331653 g.331653  ORF g.331653 m.331653 type:complete len:203 (+) comp16772_c1_seq1:236-844(+)